ncbi:hypothetical protein C8F04DRAFT_1239521 [Mycena alexandri]|uniref:Uncharacterized protein n=1 Tax=Mycena alexandri TaxID=1745969 RepID=A0AAD6SBD8_9AGAR|nr:hypothetical protein C8F04DRAFT_1239521 [Mycena alexandri]
MEVQQAARYSDYPGSTNPQKQCRRHRVTPGYSGKHDVAKIWGKISELSLASGDSEFYNGDAVVITTEILLGLEEEDRRIEQTFMLAFGHCCYAGLVFAAPWTTISFIPHPQSFDFYSQWEKSGLTFGEGHSGSARRVIEGLGSFHQQEMVLHSDAWTTPGTVKLKDLPFICFTIRCCRPTLGTTGGAEMEGVEICWTEKTIGARELEFEWQDTELKSRKQSIPCNVTLRTIFGHHKIRTWKSTYSEFLWRNEQTAPSRCVLESGSGSNPKNTDGFAFPLPSLAYCILGYRAKMWWTMSLLCDVSVMCGGGKRIYLEVAIVQLHVLSVICRWTGMLNVHKGTTDHELNMTQADGFPRGLGGSSWSGDRSDLCWAFHAQFVEAVVLSPGPHQYNTNDECNDSITRPVGWSSCGLCPWISSITPGQISKNDECNDSITRTNFKNNAQRSWMNEGHILKPYNIMDIAGTSQGNGSRLFEWRNHG